MADTTAEAELDQRFLTAVGGLPYDGTGGAADRAAPVTAGTRLTGEQAIALFDAQAGSRHLDLAARYLRAEGHGFYTIGSAGHEANAAVAAALRPSDPALLHYRSGGFYLARAAQVPGSQPLRDVLPVPRAVGIAFSIGRAAKLGVRSPWPADAITVASFGDASASHFSADGSDAAAHVLLAEADIERAARRLLA